MKYPFYRLREAAGDGGDGGGAGGNGDGGQGGNGGATAEPFYKSFIMEDGNINKDSFEHLPDHLKEASSYLGQYKTFEDFLTGAWTTKQHVGKKGLERLPEGASDDLKKEQREAINALLDIPAAPEAYELARPDDFPEEYWNDEHMNRMAKVFHENNMETSQSKNILAEYSKIQQELIDQANAAKLAAEEEQVALFTKNFGPEGSQKLRTAIENAASVAKIVGIDLDDPKYGSDYKLVAALNTMKSLVSEDVFHGDGGSGGAEGGGSSLAKANSIIHDTSNPLHAKYMAGDKEVNRIVDNLLKQATKEK